MAELKVKLHDGVELSLRRVAQMKGISAEELVRCVIVPDWLLAHGVVPNATDESEAPKFAGIEAYPHKD